MSLKMAKSDINQAYSIIGFMSGKDVGHALFLLDRAYNTLTVLENPPKTIVVKPKKAPKVKPSSSK